mgnify:CR=1 FL=1
MIADILISLGVSDVKQLETSEIEFEPSLENKQMSKNLVEINNIVQYREINALLKTIANQDRIIFHKQRVEVNDDYHMAKDESAVDSIVYCVKSSLAS